MIKTLQHPQRTSKTAEQMLSEGVTLFPFHFSDMLFSSFITVVNKMVGQMFGENKEKGSQSQLKQNQPVQSWRYGSQFLLKNKYRFMCLYFSEHNLCSFYNVFWEEWRARRHHPEKEEHRGKNNSRAERPEILLKTKHIIKETKAPLNIISETAMFFYILC